MKRTARILGLVALVAIPLAYVALGLYPQDGSPAPTAAEMGAAIAAELGVEVPAETVEAIGARVMLTPDEANLGTAPALGEAIVELAGLPETADPEVLGETALAVADQLGRAGRGEVGWGPTLASIAGLFLALVGMFLGWREAKMTTLSCVLGLGLVLGGCANQTCPDGMSTTIRAGTAGGVWSRCDGDPDSRISLTAEGRNILYALCGPGERPGGIEPIEVEGGMRWLLTCVDVDGTEREVVR